MLRVLASVVAIVLICAISVGIAFLPEAAFMLGFGAVISEGPPPFAPADQHALAMQIRLTLSEQYFNWAVVNMTIAGSFLLRLQGQPILAHTFAFILACFLFSGASIILGTGFLELAMNASDAGFALQDIDGLPRLYPAAQFSALVAGFLFAVAAVFSARFAKVGDP
ncbi:hypothetical protein [Terricaulis sp.]|uniref:hypothetical protein n=1 Tax=Terricaulis sp. TaxID=2768686 RepID=UPI002AC74C0D|nr:hypothetical protein [Terricaulis sp.]MDZ4690029.1 hypothetical protein [Terricaulis sp.]